MRHDEIESPTWHDPVLDKRRTQVENGEAEFISIDDLKANKGDLDDGEIDVASGRVE